MISYCIKGTGSPLLLVHGWGVSFTVWQELEPLLAPHFQLILIELPGMGKTEAASPHTPYYEACGEEIEKLRITLGIEQWSILSYSIGTRACESYLRQHPRRVKQAIFLCPNWLPKSWQMLLQVEHWMSIKQLKFANWSVSGWRLFGIMFCLAFNLQHKHYARQWMDEIELQSLENLKRMLFELPDKGRAPFNLSDAADVPTLFIWGLNDGLTARPLRARPNDVFIRANHAAPLLVPESIARIVLQFLPKEDVQQKTALLLRAE